MFRRAIPLLLIVSSALLAQIGVGLPGTYPGGTYPGGTTYPGGRYPTGTTYPGSSPYPTSGSCPNGRAPVNGTCSGAPYPGGSPNIPGAYRTLSGNLREIYSSDLVLETDDSQIIRMQIAPNAQFQTQFGRGSPSDFNLGDYVMVEAQQDMNSNYLVRLVRFERAATNEERIAARRPLNVSMHDKDYPGADQKTDKKKKKDDSSASPTQTTSNAADDSDPDRPHLKRASSSGGSAKSDTPVETASVAPMDDDPGRPHLHRGAPTASESASDDGMPPRPTVRATEVNGVTQVPAVTDSVLPTPSGVSATNDPVIDKARETAFEFTETLPNYTVKQFTTRYVAANARRADTSWQPLDVVSADVITENGKERYENILRNGKPTKDVEETGSWSTGEFASTLQAILSPASDALFTNKKSTTIENRPAWHYDFMIEQPRSSWQVYAGGSRYRPAYGGSIWIDKETSRVLRIEMDARKIPNEFPLDHVESEVDYGFVTIGTKKYVLPTHSESLSCNRGTTECSRNAIDFRNYRKYGADSSVTFDAPTASK
ncbi:MAG TPA: hypothetical protein VGM43_07925 [Bryobacteraceae bacterium]|jgi:hypothetical protein